MHRDYSGPMKLPRILHEYHHSPPPHLLPPFLPLSDPAVSTYQTGGPCMQAMHNCLLSMFLLHRAKSATQQRVLLRVMVATYVMKTLFLRVLRLHQTQIHRDHP
ncbi:hypothetical protein K503DRAFT_373464 [Rhizopogon vinicolor AM-OR11-026]|uniref:Uncharacterized protein n=1 Tax=Rhizopogon vinicolor AM-OR11-026 TaxID=1314800 RepID=A0A1B7MS12_9AGAM|nr:hypothetical protein K503DRAFT_373464 [Rhizopogon vinicolor AM-OR11-026]